MGWLFAYYYVPAQGVLQDLSINETVMIDFVISSAVSWSHVWEDNSRDFFINRQAVLSAM
jgi:hypothetical protein